MTRDSGATARCDGLATTLDDAARKPWKHGFMALMRRIAAVHDRAPAPGTARRPAQEPYRLGQQASLAFAPRELAQLQTRADGRVDLQLFGLGLLGPGGVLPLHYTETLRERAQTRRDMAPGDFINLFHHRAFSHLYRAWAQAQSTAGLDRAQDEVFTRYVAWLGGDDPADTPAKPLPPHARWASVAHRIRGARNPEGLVRTLAHYFGVPVSLREYELRWITVELHDRCHVGSLGASTVLGRGAVIGAVVPDRQAHFRLMIGPLDLQQYLRFTPGSGDDGARGKDLKALIEWVRAFVGFEYAWDVELQVMQHEVPTARLGGAQQLGWSSWLAGTASRHGVARRGMVFDPEDYLARSRSST